MSTWNPCLECGICCTHFRISFYWAEADDTPHGFVPAAMTNQLNNYYRCMKGSDKPEGRRCCALEGEVGVAVSCSIYPRRPTPCREFPVFMEDGRLNPRCNELRQQYGMTLLPEFPPASETMIYSYS